MGSAMGEGCAEPSSYKLRWDESAGLDELLRLETRSGMEEDDGDLSIGEDGTRSTWGSVSALATDDDASLD